MSAWFVMLTSSSS